MSLIRQSRGFGFIAITAALLLSVGCVVGPNFKKPAAPQVPGYTPTPPTATSSTPNVSGGEAQTFRRGTRYSGRLVDLVSLQTAQRFDRAVAQSQSRLEVGASGAVSRQREHAGAARLLLSNRVGRFFGQPARGHPPKFRPFTASGALSYSLFTPQVSVSFVPDVFGLNKRTVESLKAQEQQARFALAATHITLSSNIAAAAIQEASLRGQIDATNELIGIATKMLEILRSQYAKGYASQLDVAAQEAQLAQVAATLPPLLKQLAQQRDLLAALSGGFPNQEMPEKFELSSFQLPRELPLTLPSQLVEQRPDVRQAEENLHSASALIGVAHANRLPSFALTADAGSMALIFSHFFTQGRLLGHRPQASRSRYLTAGRCFTGNEPR